MCPHFSFSTTLILEALSENRFNADSYITVCRYDNVLTFRIRTTFLTIISLLKII